MPELIGLSDRVAVMYEGSLQGILSRAEATQERIMDLNTFDGVPPGWVLAEARGINNAGEIVGRGVFGGSDRAFLLTPILFVEGFEDGTLDGWDSVFP